MVCWCENERDADQEGTPGPTVARGCTDLPWCVIFTGYLACLFAAAASLIGASDPRALKHGRDRYGRFCGADGDVKSFRYVYYYDLQGDLAKDKLSGICVQKCPAPDQEIKDLTPKPLFGGHSAGEAWFVALPSVPVAGRCVPYAPGAHTNSTQMCAYPRCRRPVGSAGPREPREVCGLARDGTGAYWLTSPPDQWVISGWREEGLSESEIQQRVEIMQKASPKITDQCQVLAQRSTSVRLTPSTTNSAYELFTRYTGVLFQQAKAIYDDRKLIVSLGIGGSLFVSFIIVCLFTCCVKYVLIALSWLLLGLLVIVDYILFVQAGVATGRTGHKVLDKLVHATEAIESIVGVDLENRIVEGLTQTYGEVHKSEDVLMLKLYFGLAVAVAFMIILLLCAMCTLRRQFRILVEISKEASHVIREMPSLLLFPFLNLATMAISAGAFLGIVISILTLEREVFVSWLDHRDLIRGGESKLASAFAWMRNPAHFEDAQRGGLLLTVFGFLWVYFFHEAIFIATIAYGVSHWYFYRDDPERSQGTGIRGRGWYFGQPVVLSYGNVCRYHLGSLAAGSFLVTLVTLPRLVLEYLERQRESSQEHNPLITVILWVARCCSCCLQKCVQFITEYAYVDMAISGKPFCSAARRSFKLFAQYPVQVAMDKMATAALKAVACISVPLLMAIAAYVLTGELNVICGSVVLLAFLTTRLVVGVYDICVTTLFVCAMRDSSEFGGRYMPAGLAAVLGLTRMEGSCRRSNEIELS
eukprot:TRINITY_DN7841_c0_g1_i1.p1 TRINITY_DN7841_c0_g1~~TRINITY_DN7841_c0_g1_i1.p1  ORF type:complete len:758 (-),score=116.74 TRINITY_DN7841_c0_g1_i1:56-2329(-)